MPGSVPTAMSTSVSPPPPQSPAEPHLLDNPVWAALTGPHARFAERAGRAVRYPLDVCPFAAPADPADPAAWDDLAELVGPDTVTAVTGARAVPDGWEIVERGQGVQLVDTAGVWAPVLLLVPAPALVRPRPRPPAAPGRPASAACRHR